MHGKIPNMAVTANTTTSMTGFLRPFDIRRDLNAVADLVELCFSETLDSDGQRYLRQMRDAARNVRFLRWASSVTDPSSLPMNGFVWVEDGRLVGNLSIIPFNVYNRRSFLIANVAVHPDYRRKGIARALTLEAQEYARRRNAASTWLHVREENNAAKRLYVSQGFRERARRTTWYSVPDTNPRVDPPSSVQFGLRRPSHWNWQKGWLERIYPSELTWHLPIKINSFRPGVFETIGSWLSGNTKRHWAATRSNDLLAVLTWQYSRSYNDYLWLAVPPNFNEEAVRALLTYVRRYLPPYRLISLDFPAHVGEEAIRSAGFEIHQTLIWMEYPLK